MSRMKHLLRKLHIGGGINEHERLADTRPVLSPTPSLASSSSTLPSATMETIPAIESVPDRTAVDVSGGGLSGDSGVDFNLLEEEFQMQLALAISASDPDVRKDPESAQINAAKQMSLGCAASVTDTEALVQFQSLRYWNYNVIDYEEKVMDGFYDVHGIPSCSFGRGEMPLLVDLQTASISENVDCEVILVNRRVDIELQKLEKKACTLYMECCVSKQGLLLSGLLQKLADVVVNRMGGPVGDADEMLKRWTMRSYELRNSLSTIVLPIGCLDVGLSRHRALLFKVLADRINVPCMLVKGSYYTGTDDGAVNLIKADDGSEYIIDLMGAPGALIPAEVPSRQLQNCSLDVRGCTEIVGLPNMLDGGREMLAVSSDLDRISTVSRIQSEKLNMGSQTESDERNHVGMNQTERSGHDLGNSLQSLNKSCESSSYLEASPSDKMQVKNVSKYVLSAAKNPEFAQKLHAVLLESGAVPPLDLFSEMNPQDTYEDKVTEKIVDDIVQSGRDNLVPNYDGFHKPSQGVYETAHRDRVLYDGKSENIHPVLGKGTEYEIQWEDLHIGERIGIGSYGEVYHAEWNGTEVAVKKFLAQDFSGDALVQFKSEVEIMLRLRHPNVVLFMGAITRSPHFSILTEFLPRGSLYRLLHRPNFQLDEKRRLHMALDVAKGMNYLHTSHPIIVHRDLKSPNLLVDKHWAVKVCDFGLSRIKHHTFLSSKSTAGTPEWMAPEVLRNEPANEKCDVYSFGVILWELATLGIPWKGLNPMQVVGAVGFQNKRLEIPEDVDPVVAQIIRDCWQTEPHLRPSFSEVISRLLHLQHLVVGRTSSTH
ncbi:hypothetical protein L6164_015585 [Bauhinia variegata]|uniref:Uncharacterized protein n=1 Tax=Bauhinia variegata TaxID=167791 RepID=A0ACB9NMD1_BAUVA|nr:hypothetical protein L6164_015585 [Bauhinia variegata]